MKKYLTIIILFFSLVGCGFNATTPTTEATIIDIDNYLEVFTVEDLMNIEMNKSYILMNDLDLSDIEWQPIGDFSSPFLGNFNGNGYTISNLTISENNKDYYGLFGFVKGDIFDFRLVNINIDYETKYLSYTGGLVGVSQGSIEDIEVEGTIKINNSKSNVYAGLLVGLSQTPLDNLKDIADFSAEFIRKNQVNGSIEVESFGFAFVGGLIGKSFNTTVIGNYAQTNLNVVSLEQTAYLGGLIGHNYGGILKSYADQVDETNIAVENNIVKTDLIVDTVLKNSVVGGLIGYNGFGMVKNNFSIIDANIAGETIISGLLIGENWHGLTDKNLVIGELLFIEQEEMQIGHFFGKDYGETEESENYYNSGYFGTSHEGFVLLTDLRSLNFYNDTLGWDDSFSNKVIALISE